MQRKQHGRILKSALVADEQYNTYIPDALPPEPAIEMAEIAEALEKANFAIGELNGVSDVVPDPFILNYMYIRKEAVLSSQIEGTQSTLDDLLRYESGGTGGVPVDDVVEVSSYVAAMNHGFKRVQGGFPLSVRLIREMHRVLLTNSRGKNKTPGEFRRTQNWIGGTRPGNAHFVPPPPDQVSGLMSDLEKFMHNQDKMPALVKAALIHQQFETIHPFLDGNGRVGRLLITFYLCVNGFLRSPSLYLSLFFKQHRDLYYEKLSGPRKTGDWEDWVNFFLEGVAVTAKDAKNTMISIKELFAQDAKKVSGLGRAYGSAEQALALFRQKPLLTIAEVTRATGLSKPTAISAVNHLVSLGIIENADKKKWGRIYTYPAYISLLADE